MTAHPAIRARLAEEMGTLARLVDAADADTFLDDEVYKEAQHLAEGLEAAFRAVEGLRRPYLPDAEGR